MAEKKNRLTDHSGEIPEQARVEQWAKYEDVAMHFNDLIIRVRMRALAFVSAVAVAAPKLVEAHQLSLVLYFLAIVWGAIFLFDERYYNRLLQGAVEAIENLEEKTNGEILLSSTIAQKVEEGHILGGIRPRWAFYAVIFTALVIGGRFAETPATNLSTPNEAQAQTLVEPAPPVAQPK